MNYYTPTYIKKQLAANQRVRELHSDDGYGYCSVCVVDAQYGAKLYAEYPCPTIQALDGEQ